MRISVQLLFHKDHTIPVHYNYLLQAAIYAAMEPSVAKVIHDDGIPVNSRVFRLFTFSRIQGVFRLSPDRKWIKFPKACAVTIASPVSPILESLMKRFLKEPILRVGPNVADVVGIQTQRTDHTPKNRMRIRTLSPIVAYQTMTKSDGRKYTLYRQPPEPEFQTLLQANLVKKLEAYRTWGKLVGSPLAERLTDPLPNPGSLSAFSLVPVGLVRQHVMKYQDIIVKGASGTFDITGDSHLLWLALEAGLGSKNAQGFGCIEELSIPMSHRQVQSGC